MSDTWDSAPLAPKAPAAAPASWDAAPLAGPTAQQKAVVSANDNGEEAAQAIKIAKQTQIPATVVQSDLPGYAEHARQLAAIKAAANPFLAKYIDGNPMAAKVSGDDYDKLDEVSQTLQALHPELIRSKAQGGVLSLIPEVSQLLQDDAGVTKLTNSLIALPYHLGKGLYDFGTSLFTLPGRVSSGETQLDTTAGMDEAVSVGVGLALGGGGAKGSVRTGRTTELAPGQYSTFDDFMHTMEGLKTRKEIDDFIASKTEGPPGAMLQIEHAKAGSAALDRAVEVAQDSKTKQRSPELFEEMAAKHDDGSVHIDAAKIMELYQKERKVPAEGDGLFGFVPDIAAKAQAAAATGGEVTIPISKYIAHVDPTVHEGFKDSIRLHDDGVTTEEAKEQEKAIEAWHGTPHDFERFDLTKIGTGEGAQVYGHGLYFAENRKVGEEYQKNLSGDTRRVNGEILDFNNPLHKAANQKQVYGDTAIADMRKQIETIEKNGEDATLEKQTLAVLESGKELPPVVEDKGALYKVHINADPTHFLDWDLPLSQQQAIFDKIAAHDIMGDVKAGKDAKGGDFYSALADHLTELSAAEKEGSLEDYGKGLDRQNEAASKMLAEAGIPGIKYLDQGSRGADGGTRNFVVFDDRLVKIKEKNGNPVVDMMEAAVEAEKLFMGLKTEPFMNMLFKDAKSVGITDTEFQKYSDKIARAEQAILDKAVNTGKREAGRRLAPEWKRNEAAVRDEVINDLTTRGPFAAEKFLRDNKIDIAHDRSAEVADDLAPLFGFETGQDLLRGLEGLEIAKAASGKAPQAQLKDAIAAETAARMEARYGNLAENIAKEARETALADHTFDILADEVRILAKAAGTTPPLTRVEMVDWAKQSFEASNIRDAANWEKLRRAVERGGREAEKTLLKGDFLEAFQWKQKQMLAATLAKESVALQKVVDGAEKKIDRFSSEENIKGIDQPYLEQIRQMLASVGLPQQFAPLRDTPALRDFVADSEGQIAVAPWLTDGSQPKLQDMSVEQFRDFVKSMQSLEHVGRQAQKIVTARGEADLQNVIFDVRKELDRFPFIDQPALNPSLAQRAASLGRKIVGAHLLVERMLDYTDRFDPHGPLTEWLDRPLRDSNAKELTLTEGVTKQLRALKQHTDASINEKVPNNIIPDAGDKSGFMSMRRTDLRQVMLNMGNWSNMKKLAEGFGVNEADLRRWVDANANTKDVAWVNGVWRIFEGLKPEADAMQLRDTGVAADTIPAVPWEVKAGKLVGGYYPVVYDKFNSDIQGHMAAKNPVFDTHYVQAATPHGYTVARTDYKGALDLSGSFLASRLQGMIHDIAFREAIRNANKLISNQEFRTALAQKWGKEAADLLPSWLRDIANSHTLDDNYAQGFVRVSSLVRQNVVSTLIAYNPGTFIKHGFTAAVMSADRVGALNLFKAAADIGAKGTAGIAKDLLKRNEVAADEAFMDSFRDLIATGERGENARQFILNSSAVMRNRQRQYDDSIRGAVDDMNKAGVVQSLANFRQRQMLYGRMAVAFSDGLSAMPTWLAAYKKAYLAGESNADAVFIADKEVSRAHGSSFVGDQPLVTRLKNGVPGEIARWFVPLYKFWNHTVNNNFQLAWDAAAAFRRTEPGAAPEPGANAASISRRIALILATIFIEEQATAALDQDKKGFLHAMAMSSIRYFGGGIVGLRELSNGLASGYEPSVGMLGTLFKAGSESVKDMAKATSVGASVSKNWIIHTANLLGFFTGVGGSQVGKTGSFVNDLRTGREQPRTFNQFRQGMRTGHSKARIY